MDEWMDGWIDNQHNAGFQEGRELNIKLKQTELYGV